MIHLPVASEGGTRAARKYLTTASSALAWIIWYLVDTILDKAALSYKYLALTSPALSRISPARVDCGLPLGPKEAEKSESGLRLSLSFKLDICVSGALSV